MKLDHENRVSIANQLLGQRCFRGRANEPKATPYEAPDLPPFTGPLGNPVSHKAGGRYESSAMFERIALVPRPLGTKNRESLPEIAVVSDLRGASGKSIHRGSRGRHRPSFGCLKGAVGKGFINPPSTQYPGSLVQNHRLARRYRRLWFVESNF